MQLKSKLSRAILALKAKEITINNKKKIENVIVI